jgi:hypothetical protein
LVWAFPRSLTTTWGITLVFFSYRYLDVSVPCVCFRLAADIWPSTRWVPPFGNLRIKGCLHLPEAYRSLPRPSSPLRAKASPVRTYLLSYYCSMPIIILANLSILFQYVKELTPERNVQCPIFIVQCPSLFGLAVTKQPNVFPASSAMLLTNFF